MSNLSLTELSEKWGSDKHIHGFTQFYENYFSKMKDIKKVCEIGIGGIMWQSGGTQPAASSRIWIDYFPEAKAFILDNFQEVSEEEVAIIEKFVIENKSRLELIKGDQSKREDLQNYVESTGSDIDILVDDGGHSMEQQQVSFGYLFQHVRPGGIYVLEDLHTSVPPSRPRFGLRNDLKNSTLEMIKNFINCGEINSEYMSPEESSFLEDNIEFCDLFEHEKRNSITCVIGKKNR